MQALVLILVGLALLGADQQADAAARPEWVVPPTAEASDYPALAGLLGIEATIRLRCRADADGRVSDCGPLDPPGGLGFEHSAVAIIERGRVRPPLENGAPVEAVFSVSVPFSMPGEADVQRYQGPEPSERTLALVADRIRFGRGEEGLWWSFPIEDLSSRERSILRPILREAFRGERQAWWEGFVLGIARRSSEETETAILRGRDRGPPLRPSGGIDDPVYDQLNLVEIRVRDRARAIYCSRYPCPDQD